MKKVLIAANNSGGLFRFRRMLIEKLISEGNEVEALTPFDSDVSDLKSIGIKMIETKIDRRGINPLRDLNLIIKYFNYLLHNRPDLAILYTIKPNIYCGFVCRILHIPYAANITGLGTAFQKKNFVRTLVVKMYKISLRKAKVVFFENKGNLDVFVEEGIIKMNQACLLMGAGVDLNHFSYVDYPSDDSIFDFLFIGRVMQEKGIDELFQAVKRLNTEGYKVKLTILGAFEEDYQSIIQKYQEEGWLNYIGIVDDVRPYIKETNCFVLPSWHEGMANTNLECAATGRPVITSNIAGCKEAVINGASGFLCDVRNAESLYQEMRRMISLSYEERKNMGVVGRKHMEDTFDKKIVVENTIAAL